MSKLTPQLADTESAHTRRLKAVEAIVCMGMTKAQASEYSGLSPTGITKAFEDPRVQAYIASLRKQQAKRVQVTRDDVLEGIKGAISRAEMLGEPRTEIAGWEAINKMMGFNAPDRVIHELPEDTKELMLALQDMDTDQIAELADMGNVIELSPDDFKQVDSG